MIFRIFLIRRSEIFEAKKWIFNSQTNNPRFDIKGAPLRGDNRHQRDCKFLNGLNPKLEFVERYRIIANPLQELVQDSALSSAGRISRQMRYKDGSPAKRYCGTTASAAAAAGLQIVISFINWSGQVIMRV